MRSGGRERFLWKLFMEQEQVGAHEPVMKEKWSFQWLSTTRAFGMQSGYLAKNRKEKVMNAARREEGGEPQVVLSLGNGW